MTGQTAWGQGRFVVVVVVRADVFSQVGGARRHPEEGGAEEARAQGACVRKSPRGGVEGGRKVGWTE